jgi:NAD(P)-dependent dehydrogenase (short-subunit alcohol dehydrogenase family)
VNAVNASAGAQPLVPVVLITGCSSGFGRLTAARFAAAGYRVFASMRRPQSDGGAALRDEAQRRGWALSTLALDVTDDQSVQAAVNGALAETGGRLDVLVNNAGYYFCGPVEETTPDDLRGQLETNLIGALRLCRAVLPAMRVRGAGTIVNVSSVSGLVVVPAVGAYHASKFALEALTEALRYEVHPFGIRVVLVEPGPYRTLLHDNEHRPAAAVAALAAPAAPAAPAAASPYAPLMRAYQRELGRLRRGDPADVAETIFRAATARNPRLRWRLGPTSWSGGVLRRFVPDRLYEWVLRWAFRPGPEP